MSARRTAARSGAIRALATFFVLAVMWSAGVAAQTSPRDIEEVQRRLVTLGYDAGSPDGLLGPKTRAALRAFQGDRGLPATGRPDGTTLAALSAAAVPPPPETPPDTTGAGPPGDDPPSLEAVPLEPVAAVPLRPIESPDEVPLARREPHVGGASPTPESALAGQPGQSEPSGAAARGGALPETGPMPGTMPGPMPATMPGTVTGSAPRDEWFDWLAAALAVLGVLVFFAAFRRRSARAKGSRGVAPRPTPADVPAGAAASRRGRVFGVDVPPAKDSGRG